MTAQAPGAGEGRNERCVLGAGAKLGGLHVNLFPTGVSQWVGETRNPWVSGPGAKPETRVYLLDSKLFGVASLGGLGGTHFQLAHASAGGGLGC
jgi:hypothetical protein